jgi:hypothetical protein
MINQISYTFATAQAMLPFRHLLSSKLPFYWSEELQVAFDTSKEEIISQCQKGVRSFSLTAPTALATDWSKFAMGFWLCQKFCKCPGAPVPGCCKTGWQTVFCGSTFCTPAESRYHPIEGEACAAKKGLEKCKLFILGHPHLILCVDHKPLLATMGDQELADIPNPRLLDFKIKSLAYRFTPKYIPGKEHVTADALSRRSDSPIASIPVIKPKLSQTQDNNVSPAYSDTFGPPNWVSPPCGSRRHISTTSADGRHYKVNTCGASRHISTTSADGRHYKVNTRGASRHISTTPAGADTTYPGSNPTKQDITESNQLEQLLLGQVFAHLAAITHSQDIQVLGWDRLTAACCSSPQYRLLHKTVQQGVSDSIQDWDLQLRQYFKHRHSLTVLGNVVLLFDRPIIPTCLQEELMEHLHACHSGCNMMFARASANFYWPNYREDINKFQAACPTCRKIAPSNPSLPPTQHPDIPSYPFEYVVADFFSLSGRNYLAFADRYSNWLSVNKLPKDDSPHLIQVLREYFTYFGIPRQISSDGASIFTSVETSEFCKRWDIKQRLSSSYYPHSNKRAEVAVKSAKRMVRDNLNHDGSLHGDKFARALLIHRNTPDPATGVSPAQIIFGRQLRDHLPTPLNKFSLRSDWEKAAKLREECYMKRHYAKCEDLTSKSKALPKLIPGDLVYVQDQKGKTPTQWNKSGKVLEVFPHDSYLILIDGSYRTTRRNRKFLRKFTPHNMAHVPTPEPSYPVCPPVPELTLPNPTPPLPRWPSTSTSTPPAMETHHTMPPDVINVQDVDGHGDHHVDNQELPAPHQRDEPPNLNIDIPPTPTTPPSSSVTPKPKPKHLRERWILAPPSQTTDNHETIASLHSPQEHDDEDVLHIGEQQLRSIVQSVMHACLKVSQYNLSAASLREGGIAST